MMVSLLVVALVAAIGLGGVALVVALLANRRTRAVGAVLAALGLAGLLLVGGMASLIVFRLKTEVRHARVVEAEMAEADAAVQAKAIRLDSPRAGAPTTKPPAESVLPPGHSGVLPAVSKSLAKGVTEAKGPGAPQPAGQTASILAATGKALSKAVAKERKKPGGPAAPPEPKAPDVSKPDVVKPVPAKPDVVKPDAAKPGASPGPAMSPTDLRAEFENWLAARSDAAMSELRAEFEGWLADSSVQRDAAGKALGPAEAPRPAWVGAEPGVVEGDYQMTAIVGPYSTPEEYEKILHDSLHAAVTEYVEKSIGRGASRGVELPVAFIRQHAVAETYEEEMPGGLGHDRCQYLLLKFNREVREELKEQHRAAVIQRRLGYAAYGLAGMLAALGLAFAYLKTNLATGGRYRGRLRAAAAAVVLAAVAAHVAILAG
jgi:hypothetical protein